MFVKISQVVWEAIQIQEAAENGNLPIICLLMEKGALLDEVDY